MPGPGDAASSDAERTREEGAHPRAQRNPGKLVRGAVLAGKYRLELLLGEGGMAVVWSAYHLELERAVAVKLLRGEHDGHLAKRLRQEARAAARLAHPAIVRVLDVAATDDGEPFIVMELLTGETLASLVARERVSALRVVQLLLPIIEGLAAAHAEGVVHRDLKPDNVFLAVEGEQLQPKLLDFGIAKLNASRAYPSRLTDQGVVLGSPSYMSPEQVRGDEVDFRSDIWSLCVLLYRVIGGKAPFKGSSPRATFDVILQAEPAPLPLGAGVDSHLARIVLSGLSKDPSARPASMRQLGERLAGWLLLHGVVVDACGAPLASKWSPWSRGAMPSRVEPTLPNPAVRRKRGLERTLARFVPPKRSRWLLWALAGTLTAGGSLAFSGSDRQMPQPLPVQQTSAAPVQPRVVDVVTDFQTAPTVAVSSVTSLPSAGTPPVSATRHAHVAPRTPRATLPF